MLNQALVDEVFEENWLRIVKPNGQWDYKRVKWALASYTLSVEFGAKEADEMLYSSGETWYGPEEADEKLYGPGEKISAEPAGARPL